MQQLSSCKTIWLPFILLLSTLLFLIVRLHCWRYQNLQYFRYLNYENERQNIINHEKWQQFAGALKLNENEEKASERLMQLKRQEYERWQNNDTLKELEGDFIKTRKEIQNSQLYRLLKMMPKGAALHVHDKALTNTKFLLQLSYKKDLWLCIDPLTEDYELLRFSLKQPYLNNTCKWQLLKDLRQVQGPQRIDTKLNKAFTVNSLDRHSQERLKKIQHLLKGLLTFAPVWREYLPQVFREFSADNVQYMEMRSDLPRLYDLQGNFYSDTDVVDILRSTSMSQQFVNFRGSSLIYSLSRNVNKTEFDVEMDNALLIKLFYPDFLIGIDLVNDIDRRTNSRSLKDLSQRLLEMQDVLDYYFTLNTDEDILEAYLLGTKRITFNKMLLHHPYIIAKLASKNTAIIINPIADQVFNNLADLKDHPASILFRYNLPLAVSSNYPSYWRADPLTHDFYMVFMKIAPQQGDLRILKQLALNSIYYSALEESKKKEVLKLWNFLWSHWISQINSMFD